MLILAGVKTMFLPLEEACFGLGIRELLVFCSWERGGTISGDGPTQVRREDQKEHCQVRVRLREEEQGGRVINEVLKRINLAAKVCDLRSKLSSCLGHEQKQKPSKGDILNFAKFTWSFANQNSQKGLSTF